MGSMFSKLRFRYTMLPKDEDIAEATTHIEDGTESTSYGRDASHDEQVIFRKSLWWRRDRYAPLKSARLCSDMSEIRWRSSLQYSCFSFASFVRYSVEALGSQHRYETCRDYRQLYVHWCSIRGHQRRPAKSGMGHYWRQVCPCIPFATWPCTYTHPFPSIVRIAAQHHLCRFRFDICQGIRACWNAECQFDVHTPKLFPVSQLCCRDCYIKCYKVSG